MEGLITLGPLSIQQKPEESFENYTTGRVKSIGKIIPFQITSDQIDILIAYAIFINGERDIRTLEVQKEFNTFGRLKHGLRLTIQRVPDDYQSLYCELRQAYPRDSFNNHQTLHPTSSELDLNEGAELSVFQELEQVGAQTGTKYHLLGAEGARSSYLCIRFAKDNIWAPIVAYATTRILPINFGYRG